MVGIVTFRRFLLSPPDDSRGKTPVAGARMEFTRNVLRLKFTIDRLITHEFHGGTVIHRAREEWQRAERRLCRF